MLDKGYPRFASLAFLASLVLLPTPAGADESPLPARLQGLVMREMDAAVSRDDGCPAAPAITEIALASGGFAVAVASYASDLLARRTDQRASNPCSCLQDLATATTLAQPQQAAPVHRALRARFPQCSEVVFRALQRTLGTLSVAERPQVRAIPATAPARLNHIACPQPATCISIEPGPSAVASITHRSY